MAKRKKHTAAEQSAAFLEAAKKAEVDASGKAFERAFKKLVRPRARRK